MDELISRQAAIKSVTQEYNRRRTGDGLKLAWIEKAINETPAAQSEIKTGRWNKLSRTTFHCKECGATFVVMQGEDNMNFCPNCGTKMLKTES